MVIPKTSGEDIRGEELTYTPRVASEGVALVRSSSHMRVGVSNEVNPALISAAGSNGGDRNVGVDEGPLRCGSGPQMSGEDIRAEVTLSRLHLVAPNGGDAREVRFPYEG